MSPNLKLCLGSGYEDLGPEWITVDLDADTPAYYHRDVRDLSIFPDETFGEIRAVDIWEHLSYRDTVPALKEWARVLRPGGRLFVQVPAADQMMFWWATTSGVAAGHHRSYEPELNHGLPDDIADAPMMMRVAWRLLGGHFDGNYTRSDERWYLNAHHALFDEETIRWAAEQAGLTVESVRINEHPNYQIWMRKP